MSKEYTIEDIKDQTITDFTRLLFLVDHGVINYNYFRNSVKVLIESYISALMEERKPCRE